MPLIKRYPNRKLYDTQAKRYITLEGIAEFIRQGEDVQVLDHATGEDLTTLILTQIILEMERKQSGFLPRSVLTGLVQAGGDTLGVLRRTMLTSLDLLRQVDEEIQQRVQALVSHGELAEEEGRRLLDKLLAEGRQVYEGQLPSEQALEQALVRHELPTRADVLRLAEQLDALAAELDTEQN